jgi:hypothetical protein
MIPLLLPVLYFTGASRQAIWTVIILNSVTLSAACSTYFQLCGNGTVAAAAAAAGQASSNGTSGGGVLYEAVCLRWLAPIPTREYPNFSAWMLYGEQIGSSSSGSSSSSSSNSSDTAAVPAAPAPFSPPALLMAAAAAAAAASGNTSQSSLLASNGSGGIGQPLGGLVSTLQAVKSLPEDGESVISPVFTMWITLVALYISKQALLCLSS